MNVAQFRHFVLAAACAALAVVSGCGGGGGGSDCGDGPLFVSDTYRYTTEFSPSPQVGRDYVLSPRNPPGICNARYEATGLPAGLSINSGTGVISGRPTTAGNASVTVRLSSSSYSGSISRSFSISVQPYPARPLGWTFMNPNSPLPQRRENFAAAIGANLYALTVNSTGTAAALTLARSTDGGATWVAVPEASQPIRRTAYEAFTWLTPASDGQSIVTLSYEYPSATSSTPLLYTRRYDGTSWSTIQAQTAPPVRSGYSVALHGGVLYMVGGGRAASSTPSAQPINEVWRSSDMGANWTLVSSGSTLPARSAHCTASSNGLLYVYGGQDGSGQRTDLWSSPDGVTWTLRGNSGNYTTSIFSGTGWTENCAAHAGSLYVVFDSSSWRRLETKDVGRFDLTTGTWSEVDELPVADNSDTRRFHPGLTSHNGKLYLVGGGCGPSSCSVGRDDVWSR